LAQNAQGLKIKKGLLIYLNGFFANELSLDVIDLKKPLTKLYFGVNYAKMRKWIGMM